MVEIAHAHSHLVLLSILGQCKMYTIYLCTQSKIYHKPLLIELLANPGQWNMRERMQNFRIAMDSWLLWISYSFSFQVGMFIVFSCSFSANVYCKNGWQDKLISLVPSSSNQDMTLLDMMEEIILITWRPCTV